MLRGLYRAIVGTGVVGTGRGLWVEAEPVLDTSEPTDRINELAREYRVLVSGIAERRGAGRLAEALQGVTDAGALADTAGWWPDLALERKVELLETIDIDDRLEQVVGWARDALAEHEVADKIRNEVTDGMEKQQREFLLRQQLAAIRKELGDDTEEDVIEEYRRRVDESGLSDGVRDAATREVDRLERIERSEPGARLDPHVARHDPRRAVGHSLRRPSRRDRGPADPRRGPHRPRRREGPHRRVPGGAQAARRSRPRGDHRTRPGR